MWDVTVRWTRLIVIVAALVVALAAATFWLFRRDAGRAHERLARGSSIAVTPCGSIEYAVAGGDGPPALVVHGAGGGYDQGLDLAEPLIKSGFRVVAVSRFGYLRTPLPADASAAAQADAYACLLDTLGIARAIVFGASAGGPSSMQFALRHPDRVDALILLVPAAYPAHAAQRASPALRWMANTSLRSDYLFWLMTRFAKQSTTKVVLGTAPALLEQASADDQARAARLLDHILPVTSRRLGLLNDTAIVTSLPRYDLEQIHAPTLIVSSQDDGYGTYEGARYSAEHIPGARFVGYPTGGHLLVGHQQELLDEIERLLASHQGGSVL
jgi:2-hydroxy-6-oxonona-2,4-dienedioate hydrolase